MPLVDLLPAQIRLSMARSLLKGAALPIVPEWIRSSFFEPSWRNLIREGFKANAAVYGCVSALAMGFPEPPMVVKDLKGKPLPKHPLQQLLRRPNPLMGEAEFATYLITWIAIGGNAYIHKIRNQAGQVIQLLPFHAGHISPIPGPMSWVAHFEFDPGTGRKIPIPLEDIIHLKWPLPDPEQPWMATPPLLHVAREVDTDNEATRYLFALLKNDAVARTVIELPPEAKLDTAQFRRLKEQFNERYGGSRRGSVGLLEGGAKMNRIALNLQELAFDALRRVPEARIAAAFRVPPIVAGLNVGLEHSTYSNYREAVQQMTEGILTSLWRLVSSELTHDLGQEFGSEVMVEHDLSKVRSLQENETAKWQRLTTAIQGGWMTVNEAREQVGLKPVQSGDVFLRGFNVIAEAAQAGSNGDKAHYGAINPLATPTSTALALPQKGGLYALRTKADREEAAQHIGKTLQAMRLTAAQAMVPDLEVYFVELSERVMGRAVTFDQAAVMMGANGSGTLEAKALPTVEDLLKRDDLDRLIALIKRHLLNLLHVSWSVWNVTLGRNEVFDPDDTLITQLMDEAGTRIQGIDETTRQAVVDLLKEARQRHWGIEDLVRGDPAGGITGLRDLIQATYKGRVTTIARTELGTIQNLAAHGRYQREGLEKVLVLDNGFPNSHPVCQELGNGGAGTVMDLAWAKANPLQHPNCVRTFAPYLDDEA